VLSYRLEGLGNLNICVLPFIIPHSTFIISPRLLYIVPLRATLPRFPTGEGDAATMACAAGVFCSPDAGSFVFSGGQRAIDRSRL
jgi:hypothetical protein